MRAFLIALGAVVALSASMFAQTPAGKTLDVYFVDVEGGHATLYVSPSGESMLVDAGYAGFDGRDAGRIAAVAALAGVRQIDYFVVTHFHGDHIGGVPELAARLPIRNFVDHGESSETEERRRAVFNTYVPERSKGTHIVVRAGDQIPIGGLDVRVLSSGAGLISVPLEGGGIPNPLCASFTPVDDETSEDAYSVGTIVTYGEFRLVNLGDLSWNQEYGLVCPTNRVGTVDVLLASQHGDDEASSPTFVHALRPRVAVTNNGVKKGAIQPTLQTLRASPGIEDVWQLHFSMLGDQQNVPEEFIANLGDVDTGHWLKVSAQADGSFTVTNGRTGDTKSYQGGR
jgi:beta-lactamase superfamily II metal-dependent hydrolase